MPDHGDYQVTGQRADGGHVSGNWPPSFDLAVEVERLFDARWCWLEVRRGDVQVAGIGPHPESGRRTWWAEA